MTRAHPIRRLPMMMAVLVIIAALSTYGTSGEKRSGPAQVLKAPGIARAAPLRAATAKPLPPPAGVSGRENVGSDLPQGLRPADPLAGSRAIPPDSPTPRTEAVGRPNPFAPLVIPKRTSASLAVLPSPSHPSDANMPSVGIDLPLPPGPAIPGGAATPAPLPGAGMTVGAIIGGSERVAIIQDHGTIVVVAAGDKVGDAEVLEVREDKVIMRRGGDTFELPFAGEGP